MALGIALDWPFNSGLASGGSEAAGFPVAVDGVGYMVDMMAQPQRQPINVVKERKDSSGPNDSSLLPTDIWRRVRESWHQGNAQTAGDRETSLPYRFNSSRGVDVWSKWELGLLPDTTLKVSGSSSTPWVNVVDGSLCVVEGTNLRWYASIGAAAVSYTLTSAAVSVTQSGSAVYIALAGGTIVTATPGNNVSAFATLANVSYVGYFKDFIVAAANNVLYNVTSGTPVTIRTHPLSTFRWVDGAEGPTCIYLLGGSGDRWVVHRLSVDESGTVLNPPIVAAPIPDGEVGSGLGSYMGYLFVGTSAGLRFGVPQSTGDVSFGPLIETTYPVRCFEGQGRFVWFGLSNFDTGVTGLGRVDLTTFTEPLAPAAASDLAAAITGEVTSVTTWLDYRVFAVAGAGIYIESTNKVASGYLIESDITFGVPDTKNGHYAILRTKPMTGTATLDFSYDDGSYRTAATVSNLGEMDSGNSFLNGAQFSKLTARLTMTRSATDPTKGPSITRWEVRADAVTGNASQWNIPILIASQYDVDGSVIQRNPDEDRERLISLVGSGRIVTYREGNLSWSVNLVDYLWRPTHTNRQGSYEGTLTLLAREVK